MDRIKTTISQLICIGTAAVCLTLFVNPAGAAQGKPPNKEKKAAKKPLPTESTPRTAMYVFITDCLEGNYAAAGNFIPGPGSEGQKAEAARKLKFVLDQTLWLDFDTISDKPGGNPKDGDDTELIGKIELGRGKVAVKLRRTGEIWKLDPLTAARIPELYRAYGPPDMVIRYLPEMLYDRTWLSMYLWQWLGLAILSVLAVLLGFIFGAVGMWFARHLVKRTHFSEDDEMVEILAPAFRRLIILGFWLLSFEFLNLSVPVRTFLYKIAGTVFVVLLVSALFRLADFLSAILRERLTGKFDDHFQVRGAETQIIVIRRVVKVLLTILALALILAQFEVVRQIGVSLLASAGIAGIVIGLAAQKSISSILAGIQLAITQPVRLGDVVIVEGEYGTVEEINLTYIVVKVWDLRRLVIPMSNFLEKPFQNWTRESADLLGTIELWADYTVPVDKVRAKLIETVEKDDRWDKVACNLQVTDSNDKAIKLRALVSAADSGTLWGLRVDVREKLVGYLQGLEGGRYLPKVRAGESLTAAEEAGEA